MSNLNKRVLAAALAAVIATPAAFAASITSTGTNHAFELTATAPVAATNNAAISYSLQAGDILIGRQEASGNINVRMDFVGANVGAAPTITVPGGQGTLVGAPVFAGTTLTFVIRPSLGGIAAGELFSIAAGQLAVTAANGLSTLGGVVNTTIDVRDVTTGTVLQSAVSGNVFTSARSSGITTSAATSSTADVTQGKSRFLVTGAAVDATNLTLGTITVNPRATPGVSARGSGFAGNTNADFGFQFDVAAPAALFTAAAARDRLNVSVNFTNDAGFTNVYLTTGACIAGATAITAAAGSLSPLVDGGTSWTGGIELANDITTSVYRVCARVNGTTPIEQQTITVGTGLNLLAANARDFAIGTPANLHTIGFNGTSIDVFHINPATNALQESYIRVTNRSTTAGTVRITGRCDSGTTSTTEVSFSLPGGQSIQLSSADLENGSSKTGGTKLTFDPMACTGKRRINVTGEFSPMSVQNFLRNVTSGGTVNTNIENDGSQQQQPI